MGSISATPPRKRFQHPKPFEILVGAKTAFGDETTPEWLTPTFLLVFHIFGEGLTTGEVTLWQYRERAINAKDFKEALQIKRIAQRYIDHTGRLPNMSVPWWQWGKNCPSREWLGGREVRAA